MGQDGPGYNDGQHGEMHKNTTSVIETTKDSNGTGKSKVVHCLEVSTEDADNG